MQNQHGDFIWYDLMTGDPAAAATFYGGLLGWTFAIPEGGGDFYKVFSAKDTEIGGLMGITDEMKGNGARPLWASYIAVDDADATAKTIVEAGGTLILEPWDIPNIARVAFAAAPDGAMFYIMQMTASGGPSESFSAHEPKNGHCAWNELTTRDQAEAKAFYTKVFGWSHADTMDMGPMGAYEIYKSSPDSDFISAGMMKQPEGMPVSMWAHYFRVPNIDAAVAYINANGGKIVAGPIPIPGDEFSVNGMDPQGAFFSLVGKN